MSFLFQKLNPETQAKRARDQALNYIDNFPPIIVNGEVVTRNPRAVLRTQIESRHKTALDLLQDRRGQFLGGLYALFAVVHKTKKQYEAHIEFESETKRVQYAALQAIEREVAQRISQEGASKLLDSQFSRLSHDPMRVANRIYKTSIEVDEGSSRPLIQSQHIAHHHIQRRIWEKNDIDEFEKNQTQKAPINHLEDTGTSVQQTARVASPQGLPPPPRAARAFDQVEVQDSAEMGVPTRGKHSRQETFVTFGSVSSGGSSGHEGSSSGASISDSYQVATGLDEDDLEDVDFQLVYNDIVAMYQDRS